MSRKLLTTLLAIAMVVPAAFAKKPASEKPVLTTNRVQFLRPDGKQVSRSQVRIKEKNDNDLEVVPVKTRLNAPAAQTESSRDELLWTLKHADDNAEYYLGSGAAGDTFAMVFTPAAPAVVKEVYAQWFTAGNVNAFGADYSDAAAAISPDGECSTIARGSFDGTPIGALRTTITPNTIDGYEADWSYPLDIGGEFIVGDSTDLGNVPPFVIAFVKGGDTPNPLADATDDQGGLTYTWFGGPWTDGAWGRYSSVIELSMLVKVTYPWGAPIAANLTQLNNTYNTTGPFTEVVDLFDDVGANGMAIDENDTIVFHWTVNGGDETVGSLTADAVGADGNGTYTYAISGSFAPGDVIEYWVSSVDNDGLPAETASMSFEIKEPANPDADLLIIADGANSAQQAADLYRTVADEAGLTYEYWNTSDNFGIDASVISYGWSNIIAYGWGNKTVPVLASEADPGYGDFMANGGHMILVDQDWFFGHGLAANPAFTAGDFAYDYFGLGSGVNDPVDANGDANGDTTMIGFGVTPMDTPFSATPMTLNHTIYGTSNWADQVTAASGTQIFAGNDGLSYGVVYDDGTSMGAYFGFMADAAVDTTADGVMTYDAFSDFLNGAFDWLGVSSPPQISAVTGPSGTVLAGPYDVSAVITDYDGDAITASLMWSADETTWNEVAMTADGDNYSAQIPDVSDPGFYYWFIAATAAGEVTTSPGSDADPNEFERFVPTAPTLVNFNGGVAAGYPGAYYFGIGDFTSYTTADFPHDYWEKGLSAELASAYTTIYEITTFGPDWDNRAVVSAWLDEGAKNYFLAGDEWFGALSGWTNLDFAAGDFEYDVLGVSHSYNDINYPDPGSAGASPIEAVSGNVLTGDLYDAHTAVGDTLLYWPDYEIGADNWLDGFAPVNEADVNMRTFIDTNLSIGDTTFSVGLNRVVGDDKIVFLGFDPLSVDATPYTWWGFAAESPQTMSLDWFGITGVNDEGTKLPAEFSLAQNYPNPFNPTTTISFDVPKLANVELTVYNLLGQKVVDLVNSSYQPGTYNVVWNGTNAFGKPVSSGLYLYRLSADGFSAQHKMLYLK